MPDIFGSKFVYERKYGFKSLESSVPDHLNGRINCISRKYNTGLLPLNSYE